MNNSEYLSPTGECDLIMAGGITSGVVYPLAALRLAGRYRFRCIGGTSAGAIAAAATAAAELGRTNGGFVRLKEVPKELAGCLSSLFQPVRPFCGAYSVFIACLGNRSIVLKVAHVATLLVWHFFLSILIGVSPTLIYLFRTTGPHRGFWEWAAISAAGALGVAFALLIRFLWLLAIALPRKDFGVCSGMRPPRSTKPALTEWISDLLDRLAGIEKRGTPLMFGDLDDANIQLKMMTTNVSARRPYSLPFATHKNPVHENRYAFSVEEWKEFFPAHVMDWLVKGDVSIDVPGHAGHRFLPETERLPIVVAVRMSLSFPFLLSAVPLYRRDPLYTNAADQRKLRRCVFSDGGISSNFPIQFFDTLLPTRPTFAIALEKYSPLRFGGDDPQNRVYMPQHTESGSLLPIDSVTSLPGFIVAIIDSARLWQDNLQKVLSGYRERIAHIALTDFEGGLNLNMEEKVIERLSNLGEIAGDRMLDFDMPEHQWHRFLVAYARLEESCEHMNDAYSHGFRDFLNSYPPNTVSYRPDPQWLTQARDRLGDVLGLTAPWQSKPLRTSGHIPKPDTDLRITPKP